jgi:hypothetical protein
VLNGSVLPFAAVSTKVCYADKTDIRSSAFEV